MRKGSCAEGHRGLGLWDALGVPHPPPPRQGRMRRGQREGTQKGTVLSSTRNTSQQHKAA